MTLADFIQSYGYLAILIGTFLEGETILILGGFAAHAGYLKLWEVIQAAFAGTLLGDQLFFFLGRRQGERLLVKRPDWRPRLDQAMEMIDRYRNLIILAFRFLYGLRTVTPFALGMSRVPVRRFLILNAVGALTWAAAIGGAGFLFGHALEIFLGRVKTYETLAFLLLATIGIAFWMIHFFRRRSRRV